MFQAAREFGEALQKRSVRKFYRCIVKGEVTGIESYGIFRIPNVEKFEVHSENIHFTIIDDSLYSFDKKTLYLNIYWCY